jgi:hypothetical protein
MDRNQIVEEMARAAWIASGELTPWNQLLPEIREEWKSYQEAALTELENRIPEIRGLLGDQAKPMGGSNVTN